MSLYRRIDDLSQYIFHDLFEDHSYSDGVFLRLMIGSIECSFCIRLHQFDALFVTLVRVLVRVFVFSVFPQQFLVACSMRLLFE